MFSRRTNWQRSKEGGADTPCVAATAALPLISVFEAARARHGAALLDLMETNPTRTGLSLQGDRLAALLSDPRSAHYDPDPRGLPATREAIAAYYRDRNFEASPERLFVTASTSEAYSLLFKLLCDPGDEVLVPRPSYPLFELLAGLESVTPVGYPLRFDGQWHLDRDALRTAVGPRAKALVVVAPNNPTGSYLDPADREAMVELCRNRGLALISDEVFADFALRPPPPGAASVAGERRVLSFALSGLSKIVALPQLKVGWIAASGPEPLLREAVERLEIVSDTWLSASTPSQLAAVPLLGRRAELQAPILERLRVNVAALTAARAPDDAWDALPVEGGWTAVLRLPRVHEDGEWVRRLAAEDAVLVHPGHFYDFDEAGVFVTLSLIVEPPAFAEGVRRIAARVRHELRGPV